MALSVEGKATPRLATVASELSSQWRSIPLRAKLSVPPRDLEKLPVEVRPAALKGVLSADLSYEGTFGAPTLELTAKVARFQQSDDKGAALDLSLAGGYKGTRGTLTGSARSVGRDVATVDIDFETAVNDWLNQVGEATPPPRRQCALGFRRLPDWTRTGRAHQASDWRIDRQGGAGAFRQGRDGRREPGRAIAQIGQQ